MVEETITTGVLPQLEVQFFSSQVFWLFVCFFLFFLFVQFYFVPRMRHMFHARKMKILKDEKLYIHNVSDIEKLSKLYDEKIKRAQAEAGEILKKAQDEAKAFFAFKCAEIDKEMAVKFEEASRAIEAQVAGFEARLDEEVARSAFSIIEAVESDVVSHIDVRNCLKS